MKTGPAEEAVKGGDVTAASSRGETSAALRKTPGVSQSRTSTRKATSNPLRPRRRRSRATLNGRTLPSWRNLVREPDGKRPFRGRARAKALPLLWGAL